VHRAAIADMARKVREAAVPVIAAKGR
jgi:hypothetical protein